MNVAEKLKLGVIQRIQLLNLLPRTSSVIKLVLIKDIRKKINFTQDEIELFSIKEIVNGNNIGYSFKFPKDIDDKIEINFSDTEKNQLKEILLNASKSEKISEDLLDVCVYFDVK